MMAPSVKHQKISCKVRLKAVSVTCVKKITPKCVCRPLMAKRRMADKLPDWVSVIFHWLPF